MKSFTTRTTIKAAPEAIWALLTDAPAYPSWNTTVTSVDGAIAPGQKVTVHAKISPGRAFPVTVAAFEAPRRMVWSSGMPLGLFAPPITRSIPDLQAVFEDFAACLKKRAETA